MLYLIKVYCPSRWILADSSLIGKTFIKGSGVGIFTEFCLPPPPCVSSLKLPAPPCSLIGHPERNCEQRLNPKKNMVYGTYLMPELTKTSHHVHSRVDYNTFTVGNPMPESTLTLCHSRLFPPVRDFGFDLRAHRSRCGFSFISCTDWQRCIEQTWNLL